MTPEQALRALKNLKLHCAKRKIPFSLTLKDWIDAWGDNIDQRGKLQLQRVDKAKGYIPGNLRVGERPKKSVL